MSQPTRTLKLTKSPAFHSLKMIVRLFLKTMHFLTVWRKTTSQLRKENRTRINNSLFHRFKEIIRLAFCSKTSLQSETKPSKLHFKKS